MMALAYQLEQAHSEGILTQPVMRHILDHVQGSTEWLIQQEQRQQLQEWQAGSKDSAFDILSECLDLLVAEDESEEEVIYREYIKSLPEGL